MLIAFILTVLSSAALWMDAHTNRCEVEKRPLGKLYYIVRVVSLLVALALWAFVTKVNFFS